MPYSSGSRRQSHEAERPTKTLGKKDHRQNAMLAPKSGWPGGSNWAQITSPWKRDILIPPPPIKIWLLTWHRVFMSHTFGVRFMKKEDDIIRMPSLLCIEIGASVILGSTLWYSGGGAVNKFHPVNDYYFFKSRSWFGLTTQCKSEKNIHALEYVKNIFAPWWFEHNILTEPPPPTSKYQLVGHLETIENCLCRRKIWLSSLWCETVLRPLHDGASFFHKMKSGLLWQMLATSRGIRARVWVIVHEIIYQSW